MSISIDCQCGRKMLISEELEGLPVRCPNCGRKHLVPKNEPVPVAMPVEEPKPFIQVAKPVCIKCKQEIDVNANFCSNCGSPVRKTPNKTVKPIRIAPPRKNVEKQIPIKPEIFPGPFKGNRPFNPNNKVFAHEPRFNHRYECCRNKRHHVKNIMNDARLEKIEVKPEKKTSGLANFSFFSSFIGLVIALLAVLVISNKMSAMQQAAYDNLHIGMGLMKVAGAFAMLGLITAFFAIFHFGRKRFMIIFLSLLFVFGTFGIGSHSFKCNKSFHRFHMQNMPRFEMHELELEDIPEMPGIEEYPETPNEFDEKQLEEMKEKFEKFENELEEYLEDEKSEEENNDDSSSPDEPQPENDVQQEKHSEDF